MANIRVFPVMEEQAKKLAQCYQEMQVAKQKQSSHTESEENKALARALSEAREALYIQSKVINRELFPDPANLGFKVGQEGEVINPERPAMSTNEFEKRVTGEQTLKQWLNGFVATIAQKEGLPVPDNNAYYVMGKGVI